MIKLSLQAAGEMGVKVDSARVNHNVWKVSHQTEYKYAAANPSNLRKPLIKHAHKKADACGHTMDKNLWKSVEAIQCMHTVCVRVI